MVHNHRYQHDWTEARIAQLKALCRDGYSASEIAGVLGVTRSAIIGKIYRLGLRETPLRHRRNPPPHAKMAPPAPHIRPKPEPPQFTLLIFDLKPGQCRWPSDEEGKPFTFCGANQEAGSPYCPVHRERSVSVGSQRHFDRMAARALGGRPNLGNVSTQATEIAKKLTDAVKRKTSKPAG